MSHHHGAYACWTTTADDDGLYTVQGGNSQAFLKSKGLSQEGRKADLTARLKHYQEEQIKSMEDGTYAHPHVRRRVNVYDENQAASSTDRPATA